MTFLAVIALTSHSGVQRWARRYHPGANIKIRFLFLGLLVFGRLSAHAAIALTESVFTEIINDAKVVAAADQSATPAKPHELFKAPDLVRTGPASRVELTAADQTITRIGANTIFSFEPTGRNIYLDKGSILFHSPAGKGGGAIKHGGASAAVLGTTIIGAILADGAFKIMVLEGECLVTLRDSSTRTLHYGQMIIIPADGNSFGAGVLTFDLQQLVARLLLVQGFSNPLSSLPLINAAIQQQIADIANGTAGPIVSFEVASDGLDINGGAPPNHPSGPPAFIDLTRVPMSPTRGSAP